MFVLFLRREVDFNHMTRNGGWFVGFEPLVKTLHHFLSSKPRPTNNQGTLLLPFVQGKTDVVTTEGGAGHDHSHRFANLLGVRLKVRNAWPGSQTRNGIRKPSQTELGNPKVRKPSPGFVRGRRRPGAALARSCQRQRRPGAALARSCQRRRRLGAALAA